MDAQDISDRFAAAVLRILKERGISQAEFARRVGTNQSNLGLTLKGKHPPTSAKLAKYATALGVDVCELLCDSPKKRK